MRFVEIRGWNVKLAEDQPEYTSIRVRKGVTHINNGKGILVPYQSYTAEIKPEPHELVALNEGGSVFINILHNVWPPISLETFDPLINEPTHGTG